jgi:hypothetical protein
MRFSCRSSQATAVFSAAAVIRLAQASNNHNHNTYPSDFTHLSRPFLYSEIRSVDLSADDENDVYYSELLSSCDQPHQQDGSFFATPSFQFSAALNDGDATYDVLSDDDATVLASSSVYGCYVSSQAIMCQEGGSLDAPAPIQKKQAPSLDATASADSLLQHLLDDDVYSDFLDDEGEDDHRDDNDEDDEDDGHSSMLSNASIKRSKVIRRAKSYSGGAATSEPSSQSSYQVRQAAFMTGKTSGASFGFSKALCIRGGAAANVGSELSRRLINAAIVTLIFEGCCGHILEFFKIVMQTSPPGTNYASVFKDITSEKGLSGLWDGFVPWGVIQAVLKGGVFGLAYESAVKILKPLADEGKIPMKLAMTLAGGIAGGFQGYVLSPTLLMKTRVMTNEVFRESMSLWQTTWKSMVIGGDIIKQEGIGSLMKGANTFATKRVFDWSSRYFFADLCEALFVHLKGSSLTVSEKSIASLLGGVASTILTLPLDVLVAKTQDAKKAGVKVSAWKLFSEELQTEGWGGLKNNYMKGFEARLLHVCLTTVVMKTMAPIVYNIVFGQKA